MKLIIKGEALASLEKSGQSRNLTDAELQRCHGIDIQDDFVEYMDEPLKSKLESGYTEFVYENGKLYSVCTYEVLEPLTEEEIKEVAEYTQGQWSDGIGEGFEQEPYVYIDDEELYISPWFYEQKLTTELINEQS